MKRRVFSSEHRKKLIESNFRRWKDPIYREKMIKRFNDKDVVEKKKIAFKGNKHAFKSDNISYFGIHAWLNYKFGRANYCENPNCEGKSNYFEWSLKKDCVHIRRKENYWQLCKKCHAKYDNKGIYLNNYWLTKKIVYAEEL